MLKEYREAETSNMQAFLDKGDVERIHSDSNSYMHSGTRGDSNLCVYHTFDSTIVVTQSVIKSIANWRKESSLSTGPQRRFFYISSGKEANISLICEKLQAKGVKLEEMVK